MAETFSKRVTSTRKNILQYFCAEKEECLAIYTNDLKFPNLKIPVKRYGEFNI